MLGRLLEELPRLVLQEAAVLAGVQTQQPPLQVAQVVSPEEEQAVEVHPSQAALPQQAEQEGRAS